MHIIIQDQDLHKFDDPTYIIEFNITIDYFKDPQIKKPQESFTFATALQNDNFNLLAIINSLLQKMPISPSFEPKSPKYLDKKITVNITYNKDKMKNLVVKKCDICQEERFTTPNTPEPFRCKYCEKKQWAS